MLSQPFQVLNYAQLKVQSLFLLLFLFMTSSVNTIEKAATEICWISLASVMTEQTLHRTGLILVPCSVFLVRTARAM